MAKIFNPTKSPFGVRLANNRKAFIHPGATVTIGLDQDQLDKLERRGCIVSETGIQTSDVSPIDHAMTAQPAIGPIADAMANQVASLTDDELRAMAKAKGLKLHHKTGRAKLLEALEL